MNKQKKEETGIGIIIYVIIIILCAVLILTFSSCSTTDKIKLIVYKDTIVEESFNKDFSIFDTLIIEQRWSNCLSNYSRLFGVYNGNNLPKNDTTRTFHKNNYCLTIIEYNLFVPLN